MDYDKIALDILTGYSIRQIQLRNGNPPKQAIIQVMSNVDPYQYSILGNTSKLNA